MVGHGLVYYGGWNKGHEREGFNEQITEVITRIILALVYVLLIFLIGTIYQVAFQSMSLGVAVCKLLAYSSIIGFMIMGLDAIDNWLCLKWDDIVSVNKKKEVKEGAFYD